MVQSIIRTQVFQPLLSSITVPAAKYHTDRTKLWETKTLRKSAKHLPLILSVERPYYRRTSNLYSHLCRSILWFQQARTENNQATTTTTKFWPTSNDIAIITVQGTNFIHLSNIVPSITHILCNTFSNSWFRIASGTQAIFPCTLHISLVLSTLCLPNSHAFHARSIVHIYWPLLDYLIKPKLPLSTVV